ncbi:hypothetical protein HQ535_05835 [bacterium]|nr:hypothetical protein [bacterium]
MKTRLVLALAALSLIAAACGTEPSAEGGVVLRYGLQPGFDMVYDVGQVIDMTMTVEGEGADSLFGPAGDITMSMDTTSTMGYSVVEGPDPDTVEIRIRTELVGGTMTIAGMGEDETIDLSDAPDTSEFDTEMVLVLDPTGKIIDLSVAGEQVPLGLFGDSLDGLMGGAFGSRGFSGPVFPEEPITVGSTWTTDETRSVFGMEFAASATHTYTADETLNGRLVARIDSTVALEALDVDLLEMVMQMMASPDLADLAGADAEDLDLAFAMFEALGMEMRMTSERSTSEMTTWFDPAEGIVVKSVVSQPMTLAMTMANIPEMDGDMGIDMTMNLDQTMVLSD